MNDYERALALRDETVAHRRWMHTHAEVGLETPKAQAYVIEQLKRAGLEGYGLKIDEIVPIVIAPNKYNEHYLETKQERMHHTLGLEKK